jgi:hypothetical protein
MDTMTAHCTLAFSSAFVRIAAESCASRFCFCLALYLAADLATHHLAQTNNAREEIWTELFHALFASADFRYVD